MEEHTGFVGGMAAVGFFIAASVGAFWDPAGLLAALLLGGVLGAVLGREPAGSPHLPFRAGAFLGVAIAAGQLVGAIIFLIVLRATGRPLTVDFWPTAAQYPLLFVFGGTLLLGAAVLVLTTTAAVITAWITGRVRRAPAAFPTSPTPPADLPDHPHWHRRRRKVEPVRFSSGARRPFQWYLEGESRVQPATLTDIAEWLSRCQYIRDSALFVESDFWQHPLTFEQIRKGDCEDHALWAWRKMVELEMDAEFTVGRDLKNGGRHAWVMVRHNGALWAFESTRKQSSPMMPLEEAVARFQPEYAVDARLNTYQYHGAGAGTPVPVQESSP